MEVQVFHGSQHAILHLLGIQCLGQAFEAASDLNTMMLKAADRQRVLVCLYVASSANDSTFRIMGSTVKSTASLCPQVAHCHRCLPKGACSKHGQSSSFQRRILDGAATLCVADRSTFQECWTHGLAKCC